MTRTRPSRWWIAAVPFAVVAMLAASGYRVSDFWYYNGLTNTLTSADAGEWARVSEPFTDARGDTSRTYAVRFVSLGDTTTTVTTRNGAEVTLADGMVARTLTLDFEAEPDQNLSNCTLTLVDDQGREYAYGAGTTEVTSSATACVPEASPGPDLPLLETDVRGKTPEGTAPRPRTWSTSPQVIVPDDARLVEVRVWYQRPNYVSLRLGN